MASICDMSFDVISILGKVDSGSTFFWGGGGGGGGIKMVVFRNRSFKIDVCETTPPKMIALTIG